MLTSISNAGMADKVIEKALNKLGGKEKLQNLDQAKCIFEAASSQIADTSETTTYYKGDSFKVESEMMGNAIDLIWNGSEGWMKGKPLQAPDWKPISQMLMGQMQQFIFYKEILFCLISDLDESDTLKFTGLETLNDKKVQTVNITSPAQNGMPEGNLTVKVGMSDNLIHQYLLTYDLSSMGGGVQVIEINLANYKEVEGVMFPFQIQIKQAGVNAELNFSSIDISEIDDEIFSNPMKKE
jgi:hypothetical protein